MPYIKQERREHIIKHANIDALFYYIQPGDLAYILFEYALSLSPSFASYSQLMGELECAKQEIYRRIIAKYENEKIRENGDIKCDI